MILNSRSSPISSPSERGFMLFSFGNSGFALFYRPISAGFFFKKREIYCFTSRASTKLCNLRFLNAIIRDSWDSGSIWSIMGGYFFCLHIPLSFGGLPVICQILNQPVLDPQTVLAETASLLLLQTLEVTGALALLHYSAKKRYSISSFFQDQHLSEGRSWVKAAGLGLGFLMLVVLLTSLLADRLIGSKDVSNPELREILLSFPLSRVAFFLIYCFITPVLEEAVYRGFLLTSLASAMKWQRAVVISALVFSSAHFSPENFLQLFLIGCVLGSAYCWSGNLTASFAIHSLYNAIVLLVTFSPEN
ncbi:unnamed protein product [Spirodela intermedia]|uniref:CAAX prenyl protease 2/Lysostaphin resistance protein A-like domain-containing protein n=1 Tax=Spirodela intermedia TaxID=51605 RepID=A0A7I8IXD7_SPIIN|nr:unnamed protein product [Spirodela intermedia]CAA6662676.1 unnamed protein product [Spirodela intermedia]